ncbi:DUF418 domain-containing protein [Arthrobacter sp. CAN_C5]|uniref:DUF418 domain-containing protein n=1 Tax=Arthrobacter sp. CAN_C5 TaxID=2760706 RepID=UPI001AE67998|nr:DUF418 domain-containing protein [Arthrobacter sp. CAN_C5]MBP2214848.1 uncharacterized protein [Arthrobacter sp. CAN_C5]
MERLRELDGLRAFALLGILAVNIWFFADPWTFSGRISPDHSSATDVGVRFVATTLFEGKFYILFSFLFGYSFHLQERAAYRANVSPVPRTLRRLTGLAILGLAHGMLLYFGDILLTYAVIGLILLGLRSIGQRAAVLAAVGITAAMGTLLIVVGVIVAAVNAPFEEGVLPAPDVAALTAGPGAAVAANLESYLVVLPSVLFFQGPLALSMFLLGMAAARGGVLERRVESSVLRRTAIICLPIGLLAAGSQAYLLYYADRDRFSVLATGLTTLTAPLQTAGYVCLVLLLFRSRLGGTVLKMLAPTGRMALTNYVGQSLVLALLFTGLGLGLTNALPPASVLGVVVALFAAQLVLSRLWLSRFNAGPLEALLRSVTYGRRHRKPAG